jgi:hypothetical protein
MLLSPLSIISKHIVGNNRGTIALLAGENKESLSASIQANSLATKHERRNQLGWREPSSFSTHVFTERVERTCESAGMSEASVIGQTLDLNGICNCVQAL